MDEQAGLARMLIAPLGRITTQYEGAIRPLLGEGGTAAQGVLANDEAVRKVAQFCYPLLPGLVRLAVKESAFVGFVMSNRELLLARLAGQAARAA
ncbi:hypothetical protein G4G28_01765 [Massilia sp. Dwa41.01b]|uniref:hypothetical protein n=1 Tax=Massilia sp. Dwa41.01b TaxID=2709302 RepID=UPI0015FF8AC2|nr:hypothetical protein [Massilia sp. Dwa41.01b]QNA87505.1 hypothetical protein G4G28_01765 [Massilia sp. Dwa41.01b]